MFGRTISPRQVADGPGLSPITLPSFPGLSGPSLDSSVVKPEIQTQLGTDQIAYNFPSGLVASDPFPRFPVAKLHIPTQSGTENTDITAYNLRPGVLAPDTSILSPVEPENTPRLGIDSNTPVTDNLALDLDSAPHLSPAERLFLQAREFLGQMKDRGCKLGLFGISKDLTGLNFDICGKTSDWNSLAQAIVKSDSSYVISLLKNGKVLSLLNMLNEQIPNRKAVLLANFGYWNNAVDSMFGGNNVISDGIIDLASFVKIKETYFPE